MGLGLGLTHFFLTYVGEFGCLSRGGEIAFWSVLEVWIGPIGNHRSDGAVGKGK